MGLVGLLVWWVLWVLIDKSPTYMPVEWAECFPFRDFQQCLVRRDGRTDGETLSPIELSGDS